jgi:hypothetical protein
MKHIEKRLSSLEARQPKQEAPNILSKLTEDELRRLKAACIRTQEWTLPLTTEEVSFLEELRDKYGSI